MEDCVASYIFEVTNNRFNEVLRRGIYRYYGLFIFKGKISISDIQIWRDKFQDKFDEIVGNYYSQFTCDTWNPGVRPSRNETKITSMVMEKSFPLFDL